jgi:hypothetical protein
VGGDTAHSRVCRVLPFSLFLFIWLSGDERKCPATSSSCVCMCTAPFFFFFVLRVFSNESIRFPPFFFLASSYWRNRNDRIKQPASTILYYTIREPRRKPSKEFHVVPIQQNIFFLPCLFRRRKLLRGCSARGGGAPTDTDALNNCVGMTCLRRSSQTLRWLERIPEPFKAQGSVHSFFLSTGQQQGKIPPQCKLAKRLCLVI